MNQIACKEPGLPGLMSPADFRFARLHIQGIDNDPVLARDNSSQRDEGTCLFHKDFATGDDYVQRLSDRIAAAVQGHTPLPVVRFADGEYAFYRGSLKCNGLYHQAESVTAIRAALPAHQTALGALSREGLLAPLVFPGNSQPRRGLRAWLRKADDSDAALRFMEWLARQNIFLTGANYVPFYVVYACLSAPRFAAILDGKTVAIVNSDFNGPACAAWFAQAGSHPRLIHVPLPASLVATRWEAMRHDVMSAVRETPDCFLVGAGIGALLVCVDLARQFSVPAIDCGHILNLMNDLEHKSKGPRLFTHRR